MNCYSVLYIDEDSTERFVITANAFRSFHRHGYLLPEVKAVLLDAYRWVNDRRFELDVSFDTFNYNGITSGEQFIEVIETCFSNMEAPHGNAISCRKRTASPD